MGDLFNLDEFCPRSVQARSMVLAERVDNLKAQVEEVVREAAAHLAQIEMASRTVRFGSKERFDSDTSPEGVDGLMHLIDSVSGSSALYSALSALEEAADPERADQLLAVVVDPGKMASGAILERDGDLVSCMIQRPAGSTGPWCHETEFLVAAEGDNQWHTITRDQLIESVARAQAIAAERGEVLA